MKLENNMSCYDYKLFVKTFIHRTNHNLQVINDIQSKENVFEFTQLINSLFGLLIVPFERYQYDYNNSKGMSENDLKLYQPEYDEIVKIINDTENNNKLFNTYKYHKKYIVSDFLKHLRNSLAHSGNGRLYFLNDEEKLNGVLFYDTDNPNNPKEEFCVELDLLQIQRLIKHLSKMYSDIDDDNFDPSYHNEILKKKELFNKR